MRKSKVRQEGQRERIHNGEICRMPSGEESIPAHIVVRNAGMEPDQIWIEKRKESSDMAYYMYVHEEVGGQAAEKARGKKGAPRQGDDWGGGGVMGEAIQIFALEQGLKTYPSSGYDMKRDADIYRFTYKQLCRLWEIYCGYGQVPQEDKRGIEITDAQREARARNADTASIAKSLKTQSKPKEWEW